jgi:hypothetical protein
MKKALLGIVIAATAGYAAWNLRGGGDDESAVIETDEATLVNRIWIDHIPKNDRDVFHIFVAITDDPLGIFQSTSQWKGEFELFRHETSGSEMRIHYPQTNARDKVTANAGRCNEKDWDYCLELKGASRGVKKYYSMKGWEIEGTPSVDEVNAKVKALVGPLEVVED